MSEETKLDCENVSIDTKASLKQVPVPLSRLFQNTFLQDLYAYGCIGLASATVCAVLIFAPLFLSLFEYFVFNTTHVEDFFKRTGLHDELGRIYTPIVDMIRAMFNP